MTIPQGLSTIDHYCLSRWLQNLKPNIAAPNPMVARFIQNMSVKKQQHFQLAQMLFADDMPAILAQNPKGEPPALPQRIPGDVFIPPLPAHLIPKPEQVAAANAVGAWMGDYMKWITKRAPMTPKLFLESGGLSAIGIAIARRAVLRTDIEFFTNTYDLWVAPTSYFRKSTGLRAVYQLLNETVPHLLLASQSTPEMMQFKLAGGLTPNYNDLPAFQKRIEDEGKRFAAQRAMLLDEATKMLFSQKKYMEGLAELLMEMFDPNQSVKRELRTEGLMVIWYPSTSVLGATTPARLARSIGDMEWEDGLLARMSLLTPTETVIKRAASIPLDDNYDPPAALKARLIALYKALPEPETPDMFGEDEPPALPMIQCSIEKAALDAYNLYADWLHEAVSPSSGNGLDHRLIGNYSRLGVLAMKQALRLATMDWADGGAVKYPVITLAHWHRGLLITEEHRQSAHRMLTQLNRSEDIENEERILDYITRWGDKLPTEREIHTGTRIKRRNDVKEALNALVDAGEIITVERKSVRGPNTIGYRISDQ